MATYFALTFGLSWIGMLLVVGGPANIPATLREFESLLPVVALVLTAGPLIAGLLLVGVTSGRAGFVGLLSRLRRWRIGLRWYLVASLMAPLVMLAIFVSLSRFSSAFSPPIFAGGHVVAPLLLAMTAGLLGGLCEEVGWTGFVTPQLRRRYGTFTVGFIVGVPWGIWHFPVNVWGAVGLAGGMSLTTFVPLYLVAGVAQLTAYRVLMLWVYDRTDSLLAVVLMHASLIVSTVQTVLTPAVKGIAFLTWFALSAVIFWCLAAAVITATRKRLSRHSSSESPPTS